MTDTYDVAVIGGGPGGYVAAIKAAQLGGKVALIEKEKLGGTCLNWGCIPTKALVKSATLWRELQQAAQYGFALTGAAINYPQVVARKDQVVTGLVAGIETLIKKNKITLISAQARMEQIGEISLGYPDGSQGKISANKVIIATGSQPMELPIPGIDHPQVMNSEGALELQKIPEQLLIVGGGVVGMEFASIFSAFGTEVTVVEMMPSILPMVDEELIKRFRPLLKNDGIKVLTEAKLVAVEKSEVGFISRVETSKEQLALATSHVLIAAGRSPSLTGIDVDSLGLELQGKAIKVNSAMETNIPNVYAIGDVVGGAMLAHVASFEGLVAAANAMGAKEEMDYTAVPNCIFTHPELASVGLTEGQAKEMGIAYEVSKFPFTANGKALAIGEGVGTVKLIAEKDTGLILGGHIMGPHASDLIAEITLAVKNKLTAHQVASTIHAHPTLAESIMEAAHGLVDKPIHLA